MNEPNQQKGADTSSSRQSSPANAPNAGPGQVSYADARNTIRDGDIVMFQGTKFVSMVIRFVTGSPYSHAGMAFWWDGSLLVMEAKGSGVAAARLSHIVAHYQGRAQLFTTTKESELSIDREKIVVAARQELGKHYAYKTILEIFRRLTSRIYTPKPKEKNSDEYICSQYVAYAWRAGGISLGTLQSDLMTPGEIAESKAIREVGCLTPTTTGLDLTA